MEAQPLSISNLFCKDCIHLLNRRMAFENAPNWRCNAQENKKGLDLLTGEVTLKIPLCKDQRSRIGNDVCGPEGKWFNLYEYPKKLFEVPVVKKSALKHITLDDI